MRYKLNPFYSKKESFLLNIDTIFNDSDNSIHKARNEIKIIDDFVVKSFKIPHIINQIAYSFFRPSKAKRAYENGLKIEGFTPRPLGYCEFYSFGLLKKSYLISENFKYDFTIRDVLDDKDFENREKIFKEFAKFTYKLHQAGILHKDYSPGNILIKKYKDSYIFQIVDINRMIFTDISTKMALKNFSRIFATKDDLKTIIYQYAKFANLDPKNSFKIALISNQKHKNKVLKKWARKKMTLK